MRRAPALNIPLSRVPERQGAPRSVLPPWSPLWRQTTPPPGEVVKGNLAALVAWRSSGRLHLPALLIDRHARDLVHGRRRLGLLRRAEAQVREDLLDGYSVVEVATISIFPPHLRHVSRSA